MGRLRVLTAKELLQLVRDPVLLAFMVYLFTFNLVLQGTSVSLQLTSASFLVHDADRSMASRELLYRLRPPYYRLEGEVAHPQMGLRALDRGEAMLLLDIPPDFEEKLRRGETTSVQLLIDGTHTVSGFLAANYAARIVGEYGQEIAMAREGLPGQRVDSMPVILDDQRVWFNPNQKDTWFMPISELLEAITILAILLPAAALVREKERGTIEQLLVAPLTALQIMIPKVLGMTIVILAGVTISLFTVLIPVFDIPVRGSLPLFYGVTTLYVVANAGLGLFAATLARNLAQIGLLTLLIVAPIILLSGLWTPPEAMPAWLRTATLFSPLRHYIDASYGILLKGAGLSLLWDSVLALAAIGGAILAFGIWRLQRQIKS
ncbi:MAG: ABC transporter [Gammaproteobacteria bacterium]|nr:ABC transporter [Gammaproteobacteria bacterium]MBK79896.1 ABC transporter [Gammaproteobacteria bacterium]|tara:strand:+ start:5387 stop:6517 length:1131 start_codon:yes stop_codon:yes gene_type:complete